MTIIDGKQFSDFAVTGGGFGKLNNTPLIFLGACDPVTNAYTVSGQIVRNDGTFQASITRHSADVSDDDDVCDSISGTNLDIKKCNQYTRKFQNEHIAIIVEVAALEIGESSFDVENVTKRILDEGNGHTHGGGSKD